MLDVHVLRGANQEGMLGTTSGCAAWLEGRADKLGEMPEASMLRAFDCKKENSDEFLLSAFRALEARISSENATLFEQDAKVSASVCRLRLRLARALALRRTSFTRGRLAKAWKSTGEGEKRRRRRRAGGPSGGSVMAACACELELLCV